MPIDSKDKKSLNEKRS